MKQIKVQSLPLFEVIKDIADCLNTTYQENCGEYHLDLPKAIGKGFIKGINFDGGFGIIMYQCTFFEAVEFHFVVDDIHPIKFLYCLEGQLNHRFQDGKKNNTIHQYQSSIVASKNRNGHILHFDANVHTQVGSLEIDREKFKVKLTCEMKSLTKELQVLFSDTKASKQFYHNGFYSLESADLFKETQKYEDNDFIRRIFLEGQAYKILSSQIIQYHDDLNEATNRSLLRRSELTLVKKAARLIEHDMGNLNNIEVIAEEVGINVNKLQHGFRHMYGSTVNEYIQQSRLKIAKKLLLNSDLNISEIVDKIGLSSKSYFSKVFREAYGVSPSQFKRRNRNK